MLKSRSRTHLSIILGLRESNETSTVPTPVELTVYGQSVGGLGGGPGQTGNLKEASVYIEMLKSNFMGLGGVGFDVFLRTFLNGQRSKCVIRHISFGEVTEVVFDYTATDLKNQWVSFHLQYSARKRW